MTAFWTCRVLAVLATLAAMCGQRAAAQIAFPIAAPQFAPGDAWTFKLSDAWLGQETGRQTIGFISRWGNQWAFQTERNDGIGYRFRTDDDLSICQRDRQTGEDGCNGYPHFPLDEHFSHRYAGIVGTAGHEVYEGQCQADGTEPVTVPAGRFDTLKIVCKGFWSQTGRGNATGRYDVTLWYAPAAKWAVKTLTVRYQGGGGKYQMSPDYKRLSELSELTVSRPDASQSTVPTAK